MKAQNLCATLAMSLGVWGVFTDGGGVPAVWWAGGYLTLALLLLFITNERR